MSISGVHNTTHSTRATTQGAKAAASGESFAQTLSNIGNGTPYSDADVRNFFAGKPTTQQIADKAVRLGLTEAQIAQAMTVGGFEGNKDQTLAAQIESYVANTGNGVSWDTNGVLTTAKSTVQAASSEKVMPAAADIKAFYASHPTEAQVTEKVKSLGLNASQMVQFQATGIGMNMNKISAHVLETMYVDAANRLGTDIGGGKNGGWTSYFSPTLGRAVTKTEIQNFFAGNPSQSQIFQKASELGLGVAAVNNMMVGIGVTSAQDGGKAHGKMDMSLYLGTDGYSLDQYGHIVAGGGHISVDNADGVSSHWELVPAGTPLPRSNA